MNATARHPAVVYLAQCLPVLRAVHTHQAARFGRVGNACLNLVILAGLLALTWLIFHMAGSALGWSGALSMCLGLGLALPGSMILINFINKAALQNTPAGAVLVPGLNRRIRRTTVLLWLVAMLGWALFASVREHALLIALAAHLAVLALVWMRRWNFLPWVAALLVPGSLVVEWAAVLRFLEAPAVLAASYAGALLLGWRTVAAVFPCGGERHFNRIAADQQVDTSQRSMRDMADQGRKATRRRLVYPRLLAADIRSRRPSYLLMHVLGPDSGRYDYVLPCLIMGVVALATKLAVDTWWPRSADNVAHISTLVGAGSLMALPLASAYRFAVSLPAAPAEQGLFRLTPAAPSARAFNGVLARCVLLTCMFEWAGSLLLMLAISAIWGARSDLQLAQFTGMCGALALVGWPLRDHARDRPTAYWTSLLMVAALSALAVWAYVNGAQVWLWALLLTCSVIFIYHRYRAMLAAPVAFPAGRMRT